MGLLGKLVVVFLGFVAIFVTVIYFAFRERRHGKAIAEDVAAQQSSDARVLTVIFSAILGGMLLTFVAAWLIFF